MIDSSEMLQACLQLLPAPDPLDPKIPDAHWTCEACTYSPNKGENCELCTSPRNHDQPQHRNDRAKRCRPLQFEGNPWECSDCKHDLNESDNCDKCDKPKGPDPTEKRNPRSRPGKSMPQPDTIWTLSDIEEDEGPSEIQPTSPRRQRGKKRKITTLSPIKRKKRPAIAPRAQTPFWDLRQGKHTHAKETTHDIQLWQCKNCAYKLNTTTRCARCPENIEYSKGERNTQIPPQDAPPKDILPEPPP